MPTDIVLSTLNARYIHSAFGLRYLLANLGGLQGRARIREFTIHERPADVTEKLLALCPRIIGFGIYIWNVSETSQIVALLKQLAPEVIIVLGGPEVSHLPDHPQVVELADYVVQGAGEVSFRRLCEQLLGGQAPADRFIDGEQVPLERLQLPYDLYSEEDIKNRIIYVEASRGCPFRCEFCLSSLDKTSKRFELGGFLREMDKLLQRGARNFKFIDRTFNTKAAASLAILEYFLSRMSDDLYLHFELIPDNLPASLREILRCFPPGSLQFEVGVQTFDPAIQSLISRRQDNRKTRENLLWLREHTGAHLHADLIFGLPGDSLDNFAESFDQLVDLKPHEIQLGILKRLRGAPLNRHTEKYRMRYSPVPPYDILSTRDIDFSTMQEVKRFARYWDLIANSGRFNNSLPLILGVAEQSAFFRFMQFSRAIYSRQGSTWKISLSRLFKLVYETLVDELAVSEDTALSALAGDFRHSGQKGSLATLLNKAELPRTGHANKRQKQHTRGRPD